MAYEGDIQKHAPPVVDEVTQTILKARELLSDPDKWFKGSMTNRAHNAFCVMGAIRVVTTGDALTWNRKTVEASNRVAGFVPGIVSAFNDDPNTTHADVLALLDRAALATPNT